MDQDNNTATTQESVTKAPANIATNKHAYHVGRGILMGVSFFLVILIAVFIIALSDSKNMPAPREPESAIVTQNEAIVANLAEQSSSDEIADIEADLNATNLESLNDIDKI